MSKTYVCDICDNEYPEEEMEFLGGDIYIDGYAPQAWPAWCQSCNQTP